MVTGRTFDHLRLREARQAANLSQVELADALGIKQASVSMWERGVRTPHRSKIKAIATLLRIAPEDLFVGELDPNEVTLGIHRQAVGLTQARLAARLEIRPGAVAAIEYGRVWPRDDLLRRWCDVLGITTDQFRTAWWIGRKSRRRDT